MFSILTTLKDEIGDSAGDKLSKKHIEDYKSGQPFGVSSG